MMKYLALFDDPDHTTEGADSFGSYIALFSLHSSNFLKGVAEMLLVNFLNESTITSFSKVQS